jgi:hypothetical protein
MNADRQAWRLDLGPAASVPRSQREAKRFDVEPNRPVEVGNKQRNVRGSIHGYSPRFRLTQPLQRSVGLRRFSRHGETQPVVQRMLS